MKKRCILITFLCVSHFASVAHAQEWDALLTIDPYPSPYLSDWQNDPTLANLEIQNNSQEQDVIIVDLEVTNGSGELMLQANSRHLLIPPGQPGLMNSMDYQNWNVSLINQNLQEKANRTGMYPEGDYEVCVSIHNLWGTELVSQVCAYFTIGHPEPPELIYPIDYEMVYTSYPVFQWIPSQIQYASPIVYIFRLVEVFPSQIPERALEANYPHYENFNVFQSDLEYPLDGPFLEAKKTYAWQIQAVDLEGRPATKNEGRSIVGVFTMTDEIGGMASQLELLEPENDAAVITLTPTFQWLEPLTNTLDPIQYILRITSKNIGQTPEQAMEINQPHFVSGLPIVETEFDYPASALPLDEHQTYAWQVQAQDPVGNPVTANEGLSEVRAFTISLQKKEPEDFLPERLPILAETAAYLQLKQDENIVVEYTLAPDSSSVTINGDMTLFLPTLGQSPVPSLSVNGQLTFDAHTLNILTGYFEGSPSPSESSPLNLDGQGIPLILSDVQFDASQSQRLDCMAAPFILGRMIENSRVPVEIQYDGTLQGNFYSSLSEQIPLVSGSDKLAYQMHIFRGTVHGTPSLSIVQTDLIVEGALILTSENQSLEMPVALALNPGMAQSVGSTQSGENITLPLESISLHLSDVTCHQLSYNKSQEAWSFDLGFDMSIEFTDLDLSLPDVRDVHMSRFGIEIPDISYPDLNIQNYTPFGPIHLRPVAFRMYPYNFNWLHYDGGDIGDWGFFFDVDIRLPHLAQHQAILNQTPFRANNASYREGKFQGNWNTRTYEPAVFIGMMDTCSWGFNLKQLKGRFPQSSDENLRLGVNADFVPPAGLNLESGILTLDETELSLTPYGFFIGGVPSLLLTQPVLWSSLLSIHTQAADLTFDEENGQQTSLLNLQGIIQIPTLDEGIVEASGQGAFDLIGWQLKSGQFTVQDPFTIGLPPVNSLLGISCTAGALLDQNGLHVSSQSGETILSKGDPVPCRYENALDIDLPSWELLSGAIQFEETFALDLQEWHLGPNLMQWQSLGAGFDPPPDDVDNLYIPLPNLPRVEGNALIAGGSSQAVFRYQGELHVLEARFSHDFLFALSPTGVNRGKVDFYISGDQVALLDASGLHLGEFFGGVLTEMKIGLPDTTIAYIDMLENTHLQILNENGMSRIQSPPNQPATIRFPALKYGATNDPFFQANIDLTIDPATLTLVNGNLNVQGDPILSLVPGHVPLEMTQLEFDGQDWTASARPYLPESLRGTVLVAENIAIGSSGLVHFQSGYSALESAPRDSVVLGNYLTVTLDGIRGVMGGATPDIKLSGDFNSPIFGGKGIHFTSELFTDKANFNLQTLNVELPLGCGTLSLFDQGELPQVQAPMDDNTLALLLCGQLKLDNFSSGFNLTLPQLELTGDGLQLVKTSLSNATQTLKLYGTDLIFDDFNITFPIDKGFDLKIDGSMTFFGKTLDVAGLHISGDCSIGDTTLAQKKTGFEINSLLSLVKLETRAGNLQIDGKISLPSPFDKGKTESFSLGINPSGRWLNDNGDPLPDQKWAVSSDSPSGAPKISLGDKTFSVNAYLTGIGWGLSGQDNSEGIGFVNYQVDTYWPEEDLIGAADSVCVRTEGLFQFDESTLNQAWSLSTETPVDTITAVLDNNLYFHASTFSMADTVSFMLAFNSIMQLPLPADIVNGQVELTDNELGPGHFKFGKLHTAEVYVAGITFELLDFHFARNEMIDFSEIEFTQTRASVQPEQIMADFYLSFGANICTDMPGFEAGVDRFVIFKNEDQFHLLIERAVLWIGEKFTFDLDLIGSIWQGGDKTLFRWLIGGHLDVELGDFKGGSVVGEVSYKETVGLDNKVYNMPGFGLFVSANVDVDLKPIPVILKGFGAGFFFNPSPEIKTMVRHHLGFDDVDNTDIREEFKAIMDAMQDDMMTLWEIYIYGAAAIPDDKMLNAKALLTIATDRLRLDAKVWPADEAKLGEIVDLTGWLMAECAWKQDFSAFKYFAGHIKVGGRPATDEKYILKLPETSQVQLDFIVTGQGQFAMSGYINIMPLSSAFLAAEFDFTFGNPGFVFNGSVSRSFNIAQVINFGAGLDMCFYVKWVDDKKLGAYASAWVEGYVLDEWIAGFRGELGAALVAMPDFLLYGYAELEGTILGVSKTIRAWAKWEMDGGVSAGTGADDTMAKIIAEAQQTAEDIMTAVEDLKAEMGMIEPGGLTDEEVRTLIERMYGGLADDYYILWKADVEQIKEVYYDIRDDVLGDDQRRLDIFFNALLESSNLHPTVWMNYTSSLENDAAAIKPILDQIKSDLQIRNETFKDGCDQLAAELNAIDFGLDTLLAMIDVGDSPIQNPLTLTYGDLEGVSTPNITVDASLTELNEENAAKLQQAFEGWLARVEENIQKIRKGRRGVFENIGPEGNSCQIHARIQEPILTENSAFPNNVANLNRHFESLYANYNAITFAGISDVALTLLADDGDHRKSAIAGRETALNILGISTEHLPSNEIDRYRVLGNTFFRVIPQVLMQNTLQQADSLMFYFKKYFNGVQSGLDNQHQILTSHTDGLWDKYADLSEKMYYILDLYRSYAKNLSGGEQTFVLKDSVDTILSDLEKEFTFPIITPSMTVSQTQGFAPVTVTLNCQTDPSDGISEYAASFNDNPHQSFGTESEVIRENMLKHGVSYWYENSAGERTWPFTEAETKTSKITPRFRNNAGLTTISSPLTAELHGKDWYYGNPQNKINEPAIPDSAFTRCLVSWPYRIRTAYYTMNQDSSMTYNPTCYYCSQTHALTVQWTLENNYGVATYTPLPAKHVIEIKQGSQTVFGPRSFPVTQTTLPDTFQINVDRLNLTPDSGEPIRAHVTAYDVSDRAIGTSTGSWTSYYKSEDNSSGSFTETWEPPALYIDTTPPMITGEVEPLQGTGDDIIYRFPKAADFVRIEDSNFFEYLHTYTNYEFKLLPWNESPDSSAWISMEGSDLVGSLPQRTEYDIPLQTMESKSYGSYCLNLGSHPYQDSLKLVVRARNMHPLWYTGYSNEATYTIPMELEGIPPAPAQFKMIGLDADNNLQIEITFAGSDSLGSISHYRWHLLQQARYSHETYADIWQPESDMWTADEVAAGARLTIPIPQNEVSVARPFEIQLYTYDRTGNFAWAAKQFLTKPSVPDLNAQIQEGLHPFPIRVTGDWLAMVDEHVDRLQIRLGTVPDSMDILFNERSVATMSDLLFTSRLFEWILPLPQSVGEGTNLYFSGIAIRDSLVSDPYHQRIQAYTSMFETVETAEDGFLVLPITEGAFNGQREASFEFAVGDYISSRTGQDRYRFNIRPFASLENVNSGDVTRGARLKLPVKAGDVLPRSLIALRATALDGETCFTYREVDITPSKPDVRGDLTVLAMQHDRFTYHLVLDVSIGSLLQSSGNQFTENAEVLLKIGSQPDRADILEKNINLVSPGQGAYTGAEMGLPDSIAVFDRIFVTAWGKTSAGQVSSDSTVVSYDVPWPSEFWKSPREEFSGELSVHVLRHGFKDPGQILGYQFAVGRGDGETFDLRAYPQNIDIETSHWRPGEDLILPFSVKDFHLESYRVGVRAVYIDQSVAENIHTTVSLLRPEVGVSILHDYPLYQLRIQGSLDPELVSRMSMGELQFALSVNDQRYFSPTLNVPENGVFDHTYNLPDGIPKCVHYTFESWFWDTVSESAVKWDTMLWMPGDPMFFTADADDQDMIYVDIVREAFHGKETPLGFQFALGSGVGEDDVRSFPPAGSYDFGPDEVEKDTRLTLPNSLINVPSTTYVTLRAVNSQGYFHETSRSFHARPPKPEVLSLSMNQEGRFTAEFDASRFDEKVNSMDMWIKEDKNTTYRTIAYKQWNRSALESGRLEFNSQFIETDLNVPFVFEGLHMGYQINSLQFQYHFQIQKVGNDYQIVLLND
ncbi:hypothetical protein HQ585_06235 [candidate division KSB1 bacterium]|nr:hypothetical protein [candidate division KSB1 bacterium]